MVTMFGRTDRKPTRISVRVTSSGLLDRRSRLLPVLVASAALLLGAAPSTLAQSCDLHWSDQFAFGDLDLGILAMVVFDDGSGPALYAGGSFSAAGNQIVYNIAKWDGGSWSPLGTAVFENPVNALVVFDDDGDGPNPAALYAGGSFRRFGGYLAKWDGTSWSRLAESPHGTVEALTVFDDDGAGPNPAALYAGGRFHRAGSVQANHIAKWDGTSWSALGAGVTDDVIAITVFDDDGAGRNPAALYAGGRFVGGIAKWDGSVWSALGNGLQKNVNVLTVFDDDADGPNPPALYAGSTLPRTDPVGVASTIAKWDGAVWSALGVGMNHHVFALEAFDDGSGPALYAGGSFSSAGGSPASGIAKWNGTGWSPVDRGMDGPFPIVNALRVFDDGEGPALFAGGLFTSAGGVPARMAAKWDGMFWSPLGTGWSQRAMDRSVHVLTVFDDDSAGPNPPELYAGGTFYTAGAVSARRIAKWDGNSWSPLGSGMDLSVDALTAFDDDASGPNPLALYAGGQFHTAGGVEAQHIAIWDGSSWSPLGTGVGGPVLAMTVFDDDGAGPNPAALYAGGSFRTAGEVSAGSIAKWDGTSWSSLDGGIDHAGRVYALTVFDDDGVGPNPAALYAGGQFCGFGGHHVPGIARWDGAVWSAVGGGFNSRVSALTVYDDDGAGPNPPALYAAGLFSRSGQREINYIAKWDGTSWSGLGSGILGGVNALAVFDDDASGPNLPALYAGGEFLTAGGVPANYIAKWDGAVWTELGIGVGGRYASVEALAVFDEDQAGPKPQALFAGGAFTTAGGLLSGRIAKWTAPFPLTIDSQPLGRVVCLAENAGFSVAARGEGPLTYQWFKDGRMVDGATEATLQIPDIAPENLGTYEAEVSDGCTSVLSASADLTLDPTDSDGDGVPDCDDQCSGTPPGIHVDADGCPATDCNNNLIDDATDLAHGTSADCDGNGVPDECDSDRDGDGLIDACDGCPDDPDKSDSGTCGCGTPDTDSDGDGVPDCIDACPGFDDKLDSDGDGVPDGCDNCPNTPNPDQADADDDGVGDACPGCVPPVIGVVGERSVDFGEAYTEAGVLERGTPPVTWELIDGPQDLTIEAESGSVTWPSAGPAGEYSIVIRATNECGSDEHSWTLSVGQASEPVTSLRILISGPGTVLVNERRYENSGDQAEFSVIEVFSPGDSAVLTAGTIDACDVFVGWEDASDGTVLSTEPEMTIRIDEDLQIRARFIDYQWVAGPCCGAGACQAMIVGFVGWSAKKRRQGRS